LLREKKATANALFTGEGVKETTPGIIINNVKDALAVSANIIDSAEHARGSMRSLSSFTFE